MSRSLELDTGQLKARSKMFGFEGNRFLELLSSLDPVLSFGKRKPQQEGRLGVVWVALNGTAQKYFGLSEVLFAKQMLCLGQELVKL